MTLIWQLFVLTACCSGVGLALRVLLPKEFSLCKRATFTLTGGFFLVPESPKPGLSWGARPDFRVASLGRGSGAGVVVP
jgi:hypothetical protein